MDTSAPSTPSIQNTTLSAFKPADDQQPQMMLSSTMAPQQKKCIHHRSAHCGRIAGHAAHHATQNTQQQLARILRATNNFNNLSGVINTTPTITNYPTTVATASTVSVDNVLCPQNSDNSCGSAVSAGTQQSNLTSGQVAIQNQVGLVQPLNAALLAERYLLLDLVDGSALYKCIDVKTHEELVCKVANNPCVNLLTAHFRLAGHNHVNPLHKVIQGLNQTYLFFTPSQGDLHSYVRVRKRLREAEGRRLFRQMCEVVKCCHEQGIVLRDLKLRKFVFADAERTHLRLESLEDAVVLDNPAEDFLQDKRGCPAYVSPEILKANTTYSGKAADMWSLGVILYTMLVGRYPFNDSEHASLFAKISRGQFLVPDCLTSKARCMIRALLRRDPAERITSEDILLHPWMTRDDSKDFTKSPSDQCVPDIYFEEDESSA